MPMSSVLRPVVPICPIRIPAGSTVAGTITCASFGCRATGTRFAFSMPSIPGARPILLIGGDKTGNDRFYEEMIPVADALYDQHIDALTAEGLIRK